MTDISVIIVNYNTADLLRTCIDSVLRQRNASYEVIVVDNASHDHSHAILKEFGRNIIFIPSSENLGFGKANNLAFEKSSGRYVFLLNPDTELQSFNTLKKIVTYLDHHPNCGLLGTRIVNDNYHETLPRIKYPGERHAKSLFPQLPGDIAWILGASMVMPSALYKTIKGFDPDYFLYGEDVDLCLRVRKQGYEIHYLDRVTIKHIGQASERKTTPYEVWCKKQKGLHLFLKKHYSPTQMRHVLRSEKKRAALRLFLLKIKNIFSSDPRDQDKYQKYRAIRALNKAELQ